MGCLSPVQDALPSMNKVRLVAEGIQEVAAQKLNAEQRLAVASVLCGAGGSTPFALFGPPGTGKTVTLVESALQVRKRGKQSVRTNFGTWGFLGT